MLNQQIGKYMQEKSSFTLFVCFVLFFSVVNVGLCFLEQLRWRSPFLIIYDRLLIWGLFFRIQFYPSEVIDSWWLKQSFGDKNAISKGRFKWSWVGFFSGESRVWRLKKKIWIIFRYGDAFQYFWHTSRRKYALISTHEQKVVDDFTWVELRITKM